ncbi:MAG: hypothetical protein A2W08_07450 [Candidatus Rokubacteria bacterium RBG_16_73_20]|nr:MAG: hypothetical protein A2W08_07450 [Candidatus Rokubacteria bacterium RBG_16_73_20]
MIAMVFALALILALVVGPLVWRLRADRRHARAEALLARVRSAVNRRFRGESMLSIEVHPPTLRRPGRVVLSTPHGYEWLAEEAWPVVAAEVPGSWELVVRPARAAEREDLARAA